VLTVCVCVCVCVAVVSSVSALRSALASSPARRLHSSADKSRSRSLSVGVTRARTIPSPVFETSERSARSPALFAGVSCAVTARLVCVWIYDVCACVCACDLLRCVARALRRLFGAPVVSLTVGASSLCS
jgi:hypothetical protein